jgi:hypothetical protein
MIERKEKRMKIPKTSTIRGKINGYAYKAGFTLHPQHDGTYSLFDIKMNYYTNQHISMNDVVRVVHDELYAIQNSKVNAK